MSEREEERKTAADEWMRKEFEKSYRDNNNYFLASTFHDAHVAGQICGEQRAAGEIARYEKLMVRDLTELRNQSYEIAALREYIRWHRTNTTGTPTYSDAAQAAVLRALEGGR